MSPATARAGQHGGPRSGAGRPALYGEPMVARRVRLDRATAERVATWGAGSLSAGLRQAVHEAAAIEQWPPVAADGPSPWRMVLLDAASVAAIRRRGLSVAEGARRAVAVAMTRTAAGG